MRIFDRYILKEVAIPFLAISGALIILFMTYSLTSFLTKATEGTLTADAVFTLTGLKVLIALEVLLPVSLYISLMVALGRLYTDWEITAFKASGISERRIILPVIVMASVIALAIAVLSLWVRPWAYASLYQFQADAEAFSDLDRLEAGRFHFDEARDRVVFMDTRLGNGGLSGLFVRSASGAETQVISADSGRFDAYATETNHQLHLFDARVFRQGSEGRDLIGRFAQFSLWLPISIAEPVGYKPKAMSNRILNESAHPADAAELQWRLSTAVSAMLLALLAFPLSRTQPRRGRYAKVMLAVVIYALYYNLIGVARTGVEQQATTTLWWAPAILSAVVVIGFLSGRRRIT